MGALKMRSFSCNWISNVLESMPFVQAVAVSLGKSDMREMALETFEIMLSIDISGAKCYRLSTAPNELCAMQMKKYKVIEALTKLMKREMKRSVHERARVL